MASRKTVPYSLPFLPLCFSPRSSTRRSSLYNLPSTKVPIRRQEDRHLHAKRQSAHDPPDHAPSACLRALQSLPPELAPRRRPRSHHLRDMFPASEPVVCPLTVLHSPRTTGCAVSSPSSVCLSSPVCAYAVSVSPANRRLPCSASIRRTRTFAQMAPHPCVRLCRSRGRRLD